MGTVVLTGIFPEGKRIILHLLIKHQNIELTYHFISNYIINSHVKIKFHFVLVMNIQVNGLKSILSTYIMI